MFNVLLMVTQPNYFAQQGNASLLVFFCVFSWGVPLLVSYVSSVTHLMGPTVGEMCFLKPPADSVNVLLFVALIFLSLYTICTSVRKLGIRLMDVNGTAKTKSVREVSIFVLAFFSCQFWSIIYELVILVNPSDSKLPFEIYAVLAGTVTVGLTGLVDSVVWYHFLYRSGSTKKNMEDLESSFVFPTDVTETTLAFEVGSIYLDDK
jgi:hypothetical protein